MKQHEMTQGVRGKKYSIRLSLVLLAVVLIGTALCIYIWKTTTRKTEEYAITLAKAAQAYLSADLSALLEAKTSNDPHTPSAAIGSGLMAFTGENSGVSYAYLYRLKEGTPALFADSLPPEDASASASWWATKPAMPEMATPFQTGTVTLADGMGQGSGHVKSVLLPIKHPQTSQVIAVLGIDLPANVWYAETRTHVLYAAAITLCVLVFLIALFRIAAKDQAFKALAQKQREQQALFQTIFTQVPVGIAIMKDSHLLADMNPAFTHLLGRTEEELRTISWMELTHPDDLQKDLDNFKKFQSRTIQGYSMEKRYLRPDGTSTWVNMIISGLQMEGQDEERHLCIIQNIDARKQTEESLRESERSKAVLLSHLPGMAYRCRYDQDWTVLFVSDGCYEVTGYMPESLLLNRDLSFNELITPEYRDILWAEWTRVLSQKRSFRYEYEIAAKTGERKWVLELGQGIYSESGEVEALEGIIIDITEQKKREAQIKFMRDHDFLTGLYNRQYFEQAKQTLEQEGLFPLSIMICDINGVRLINDAFGHAEGDRLIIGVAHLLQACCQGNDVLARTGGDEFRILMPGVGSERAYNIYTKLKNVFERYNTETKAHPYDVSVSIGYAAKENAGEKIDQISKTAEDYMNNRKLLNRKSSHNAILSSIMATMYAKSQETEEHAERIARLSKQVGIKLGLSQESLDELELFSMLHDIGKVGIDDRILNKPDKLGSEEWAIMKRHPEIGHKIVVSAPELEHVAEYILSHHERWDGSGYPRGLKGEEIPLLSRILAIADAYDAMTADRVYRKALPKEEAIAEIKRNMGSQFDPMISEVFIASV